MSDTISAEEVAKMLIGKTIKEVKLNDIQGRHLGIEELIFSDGSVACLTGNADEAHVWQYIPEDGSDAALVIHDADAIR